jgi:heme a synthase
MSDSILHPGGGIASGPVANGRIRDVADNKGDIKLARAKAGPYGLPSWYVPAFCTLVVSTFFLIALGGSVRLMNAGLACPDWPLCFGDVIPDYHPQVYFEFIHRVVAGLVSIATAVLFIMLWRSEGPRSLKQVAAGTTVLLLTQVIFGGLTVLLQLHSKVVAAHLGMGTGFFALLLWMYLHIKNDARVGERSAGVQSALRSAAAGLTIPSWAKKVAVGLLVAVYAQIILGGLVASHFASLVCTDFPTCHGEWFPTFKGIIGLHVIHRLGAYTVFALILAGWLVLRAKAHQFPRLKMLGGWMFAVVCLQIVIGIANVLLHTPPLIAVAHLAVGTLVLSIAVRLLFEVTAKSSASAV